MGLVLAGNLFLASIAPATVVTEKSIPEYQTGLYPDVNASEIQYSYTYSGGTGVFTASGYTDDVAFSPSSSQSVFGNFSLTAYVDSSGNVISGDADTMEMDDAYISGATLFDSGTGQAFTPLSAFGWEIDTTNTPGVYGGLFEFEFVEDSTPGTLVPAGKIVEVTLTGPLTDSSAPSFSGNFSGNDSSAQSDAYPAVPEPSSAALLIGAAGLLWRRRRSTL
jgi:hypothetical protein